MPRNGSRRLFSVGGQPESLMQLDWKAAENRGDSANPDFVGQGAFLPLNSPQKTGTKSLAGAFLGAYEKPHKFL